MYASKKFLIGNGPPAFISNEKIVAHTIRNIKTDSQNVYIIHQNFRIT